MDIRSGPPDREEQAATAGVGENLLIAKLPPYELAVFTEQAEEIKCSLRDLFFEDGEEIEHVYFPVTAMGSSLTVLSGDVSIEALTVGYEGMLGLPIFHGVSISGTRGVCQVAGDMYRVEKRAFLEVLDESPELRRMLHRYSQYVNDTMAQSAACNSIHLLEQRCARWLLITADAIRSGDFTLTQELLAQMLGVRRSGVTAAMGSLERRSLISNRYGAVRIVDRDGLAKIACECYKRIADRRRELLV